MIHHPIGRHALLPAILCCTLLLPGCSSTRPLPYSGIPSARKMAANDDATAYRIPYVYSANPRWQDYRGAVVEPVTIYSGADHQFEDVSVDEQRSLAQYMQKVLDQDIAQRFPSNNVAGARTLRIRATLTGARLTTRGLSTFLRFDLGGAPVNAVQSARGREGLMTGTVSYAVEISDASSNQLLYAYVGKQYPNAYNVSATLGKLDASKVGIDKAGEDLLARLQ